MLKNSLIILLIGCLSGGGYLAQRMIHQLNQALLLQQVKHKKAIARTKIRERGKRVLVAIPVAGLLAASWLEKQEYDEWKSDHPQGSPEQYAEEISRLTTEMAQELYQQLRSDYSELESAAAFEPTPTPSP